jgi:hypothetical protein
VDEEFRRKLEETMRAQGAGVPPGVFSRASLTVTRASAWILVPDELAMDAGMIPDTRPRPPWRTRARWRAERWRGRAARRAYRMISGEWPYEPDPYE